MIRPIDDIVTVTDLLHARALDQYRERSAETQRVQDELDELDRLRAAVQADTESLGARRLAGADTMWQGWIAQRRTRLQQEMAIARARQLESLGRMKGTFAQLDAARSIAHDEAHARRMDKLKKEADNLDWLSTMTGWDPQD